MVDKDPIIQDLSGFVKRPADAVMHILDDERTTQVRGVPWMYHGLNSAIDIIDLMALEKAAVKVHSALSGAIKKKGGDAGQGFTGELTKIRGKTVDNKPKVTAYENFAGGAGILNLGLDEEFQLFTSNRPSLTFGGFIDFLVRDMAWGFGVSPEFIWSVAGLSGPNARLILEDAKWFFEELQDLLVSLLCRKTYTWVIARAMMRGELPMCKDPQWWLCDWIGPQKITIDQGREGQLELDRLNAACGTWEGYWAARGKSGKKMVEKRIDEIAAAMVYAEDKNVPFDYVLPLKPGAQSVTDDGQDDEPSPTNGSKKNGSDVRHLTSILTTRI
jgi:capsid protein